MESSIKNLKLSNRTEKALIRSGVTTINKLYLMNTKDLEKIIGIGKQSLNEIIDKLNHYRNNDNSIEGLRLHLLSLLDRGYDKDTIINELNKL